MSKLPKPSKLPGPPGRAPERTVQSLTRTTSSSTTITTIASTRVPSTSRAGQPGASRYGLPQPPRAGGRAITAPTPGAAGYSLPQPPRAGDRAVTAPTPGAGGRVPARAPPARTLVSLPARTPAAALPPPRPGPSVSQPRPDRGLGGATPVYQKRTVPKSFGYAMPGPSSAVPGPAPKTRTTTSSKAEVRGGKKIKTMKTTTAREPSSPYQELPEGMYTFTQPMKPGAGQYSSPRQMRQRFETFTPRGLEGFRVQPETTMPDPRRQLRKHPRYKEMYSGSLDIRRPAYGPPTEEDSYYTAADTSMMHRTIAPGEFDFESPIPSPVSPAALSEEPGTKSPLQEQMHRELMQETMRSPGQVVKTSGTRTSRVSPHMIMTDEGPVEVDAQIITEKMVERSPTIETISKQIVGVAKERPGEVRRIELDTERIEAPPSPPTPGQPLHEVISVTSSVATAGDFKEITKTVTYESTKETTGGAEAGGAETGGVNVAEVSRMVEEEAEEVDKALMLRPLELKRLSPGTYGVRKRAHELLINPSSVSRIEESVIYPLSNPDQEQEELQPELMASIMNSEERGIQMGAFPGQLCDMLFPDGKSDVVDVSSAAPAPLQDVVVPMEIPQRVHASAMNDELERAIYTVDQLGIEKPKDSAYFDKVPAEKAAPLKNVAKRKKKKALPQEIVDLRAELPPWNADELKTVIDLVGAEPNSVLIASAADEETLKELEKSAPETVTGIEYFLQLEPPTHVSRVQLRGSTKPPWFPGYVLALPEFPELTKVVKHPTAVINAAWQAVQPKVFPEDSILIA